MTHKQNITKRNYHPEFETCPYLTHQLLDRLFQIKHTICFALHRCMVSHPNFGKTPTFQRNLGHMTNHWRNHCKWTKSQSQKIQLFRHWRVYGGDDTGRKSIVLNRILQLTCWARSCWPSSDTSFAKAWGALLRKILLFSMWCPNRSNSDAVGDSKIAGSADPLQDIGTMSQVFRRTNWNSWPQDLTKMRQKLFSNHLQVKKGLKKSTTKKFSIRLFLTDLDVQWLQPLVLQTERLEFGAHKVHNG